MLRHGSMFGTGMSHAQVWSRMLLFFFFFFFLFSGGKWRDLAMVTKNHHYICLWPLFRPHDSPVRGIKVTEPDLNSPWELPRSGSYSTPALESPVGFLLY